MILISYLLLTKKVSPGTKSSLEVIPSLRCLLHYCELILLLRQLKLVSLQSPMQVHQSLHQACFSNRNYFLLQISFPPAKGSNCLNKKPIKIIINEAIAASTCALSSSGVIVSIEKICYLKYKRIRPIITKDYH